MPSIPLPHTAVQDRVTLTQAEVTDHLGIETPTAEEAAAIDALILKSKQVADRYLNNPFKESVCTCDNVTCKCFTSSGDDNPDKTIPDEIKCGLLAYIAGEWPTSKPGGGASAAAGGGTKAGPVVSEKVGDLSRTYANTTQSGVGRISNLSPGMTAALVYWEAYRLIPLCGTCPPVVKRRTLTKRW